MERNGSPNCRKKEEIEQLRPNGWDTRSAHPLSGNAESVVPPDKDIGQKENPPGATSGFPKKDITRLSTITGDFVDNAIFGAVQVQRIAEDVQNLAKQLCPGGVSDAEISQRSVYFMRILANGTMIYERGFSKEFRKYFRKLTGIKFEKFGEDLEYVSDNLGAPIHWWGRR